MPRHVQTRWIGKVVILIVHFAVSRIEFPLLPFRTANPFEGHGGLPNERGGVAGFIATELADLRATDKWRPGVPRSDSVSMDCVTKAHAHKGLSRIELSTVLSGRCRTRSVLLESIRRQLFDCVPVKTVVGTDFESGNVTATSQLVDFVRMNL
jgi:hypothetical protein